MARTQPRRVSHRSANWVVRPANQVQVPPRISGTYRINANGDRLMPFKFLDDVRAAGLMGQFIDLLVDLRAAGLNNPFVTLLGDIKRQGFQQSHVTQAELIFQGHRAMLVEFNKFLPQGFTCSVPPEEDN